MDLHRDTLHVGGSLFEDAAGSNIDLPLVSVIVVNFNYGRFLAAAYESIARQTYPRVECIIVDNASTDETPEILRAIEARDPDVRIVHRAGNGGQTQAALEGFALSRGAYVIFVDADDLLLPHCVETHVFVHLSLRLHVGFTSGDVLQLADDQVVLGTEDGFNRLMRRDEGLRSGLVRPYRHAGLEHFPSAGFDENILDGLRFAPPTREWLWSPTSGNCFRRDALNLFADKPELAALRTGTDLYFCIAINAVSGSVLIDVPLAVYRIHGGNMFSRRAQLNHVLCYVPGGSGDSNAQAEAYIVDQLVEQADRFVGRGWTPFDFLWLLRCLNCPSPERDAPRWVRKSRVAHALAKNFFKIAPLFDRPLLLAFMAYFGVPLTRLARLAVARKK
jgi:glycosyltransferase involved in cell wall biosynthesis